MKSIDTTGKCNLVQMVLLANSLNLFLLLTCLFIEEVASKL